MPPTIARLAPSPTGLLHVGNARSLWLAWLAARARVGKIYLRIEDLVPDCDAHLPALLEDLRWLGLAWDRWPGTAAGFLRQSERAPLYAALLAQLGAAGMVYPCVCTRRDIDLAARAPHLDDAAVPYPGTCRGRFADEAAALTWERARAEAQGRPQQGVALRLQVPPAMVRFDDRLHGVQAVDLAASSGDIVVRRKDGGAAYMFAVVVDDWAMGVTEVVRGDDLLAATAQQLAVYAALQALRSPLLPAFPGLPEYAHVGLVLGDDGRRLAKRNQSLHIGALRQDGVDPAALHRWMAASIGLPAGTAPGDLGPDLAWLAGAKAPVAFGDAARAALRHP